MPQQDTFANSRIFRNALSFIYCNKIGNFQLFGILILALTLKSKTWGKSSKNFQNSWISENLFFLRKLEICDVSEFLILAFILKSKTWKTLWKFFEDIQISKNFFYLTKLEVSDVSEFLILAFTLRSKTPKTKKITKTAKFQRICFL